MGCVCIWKGSNESFRFRLSLKISPCWIFLPPTSPRLSRAAAEEEEKNSRESNGEIMENMPILTLRLCHATFQLSWWRWTRVRERRGWTGSELEKMLRNFLSCVNGPRTRQKCAISTLPKRNVSIACVELPSKASQKLENAHNCGRSFKAFSSSMEKKYQLKIAIVLLLSVMKEWGRNCFMFFAAFISHSCTQHNFFYACMSTREKVFAFTFLFLREL